MNLTENHVRVLAALRGASVLKREPGTLTPDGYEHWWSLPELAQQGRLEVTPELCSAARGLYKNKLLAVRTVQTVTRYALTHNGYLALAQHEAGEGTADMAAAVMELDQAEEDARRAQERVTRAEAELLALSLKIKSQP